MAKIQAHTKYLNKQGDQVPGVTTIVRQLDKPHLIVWANRLGLKGIDCTKYLDEQATIGTLAHELILSEIAGRPVNFGEYTPEQLAQAESCFKSYKNWAKGKSIEPILVEKPLVSETYQTGGTMDFYGLVEGKLTLIDYKTGELYPEYFIQGCGYTLVIGDCGYKVPDEILLLGIPKTEGDSFSTKVYRNFGMGQELFKALRRVYDFRKVCKML